MNKLSAPKLAVLTPLAGVIAAWFLMVGGMLVALFERELDWYASAPYAEETYTANWLQPALPNDTVKWSIYLFLAAVVVLSLAALWGQRRALRARAALGQADGLARAAHRFANLMVWLGLGLGVVFVFGNFMGSFNNYSSRNYTIIARVFGVYLPILLATALVVVVLLRAFVFRADETKFDHEDESVKAAERARRRNLGLGYAVPILSTAFAIILGLLIYDATKTALQTWVWVLIQAIVIGGIVIGTRFANRAKLGETVVVTPKAAFASLAAGAANLNFILSIAFAGVVSIISISSTGQAVEKLYVYGTYGDKGEILTRGHINAVTPQWLFEEITPAFVLVLLVTIGTYLTITLRNKSQDA